MMSLEEMLKRADERGLSDREIAAITGRNYTTVWRWRTDPKRTFKFDEGILRLMACLDSRERDPAGAGRTGIKGS